jgi:hypothetical protein
MTNSNTLRKRQFKAALAIADVTLKEWAASENVTPMHLNEVLLGNRTSERLNTAIDAFIAKPRAPKKSAA